MNGADRLGTCYILMPVFNGSNYLAAQLASIHAQTHEDWLLLARDDASSDGSAGILNSFASGDDRFRVIRGDTRLGIEGNLRVLLGLVPQNAEFVAFADQDDLWMPDKLETMLGKMSSEVGPVLVHADSRVVDSDGLVLKKRFVSRYATLSGLFGALLYCSVQGASMVMNRALCELVRDLPHNMAPYDRYIHLVAEFSGERRFLDRPLMEYRQHRNNAIGAAGKYRVLLHLRYPDDCDLAAINSRVMEKWGLLVPPKKRAEIRSYKRYMGSKSTIVRATIVVRRLYRRPDIMLRELVRVFFPGPTGLTAASDAFNREQTRGG
jgi:rhamnosyltransferase